MEDFPKHLSLTGTMCKSKCKIGFIIWQVKKASGGRGQIVKKVVEKSSFTLIILENVVINEFEIK